MILQTHEHAVTPWFHGAFRAMKHRLVFGQTYEDAEIELRAIPPWSRVFCIAGAGYTAQALAAEGHRVTAVDISPVQLEYARKVCAGEPPRDGIAEHALRFGRRLAMTCGWTRQKLETFLNLSDCDEQVAFWDIELDTLMWRRLVDTLLAPRLLRLAYRGSFVAVLPEDFGLRVRERLRRGWAHHSNRSNPFAALLLLGKPLPLVTRNAVPVRFACADASEFLENCRPGSFDAFALSNIGNGVTNEYRRRLNTAVERAAARDAVVVERSFSESVCRRGMNWAARDRSHLWGIVKISRIGDSGNGGAA